MNWPRSLATSLSYLAIDTKKEEDGEWYVYLNGGRTKTDSQMF